MPPFAVRSLALPRQALWTFALAGLGVAGGVSNVEFLGRKGRDVHEPTVELDADQ